MSRVPTILGAATTGMVGLMATRFFGRSAGWCAGLLYALLPMAHVFSRLGMIDHHIAIAFLATGMLWVTAEIVGPRVVDDAEGQGGIARAMLRGTMLGAIMFALLSMSPGTLLEIFLIQVVLGVWWLGTANSSEARRRALIFTTSQLVVAVATVPFALGDWSQFGNWSPLVFSYFQPVYFGCAAGSVWIARGLHERTALGATWSLRCVSAIGVVVFGAALLLAFVPALREGIFYAGGWFGEGEEILGDIFETRPALAVDGGFAPDFVLRRLGPAAFLLPFAWIFFARRAWRKRDPGEWILLWWVLGFTVLTVAQWRFGTTLAPVYSILIGAALGTWLRHCRTRFGIHRIRVVVECLCVVFLIGWTLAEFGAYYRPMVQATRDALRSEQIRNRGPLPPMKRLSDIAARWIAQNTTPTSGYLDASKQPEYGVLTSWSTGHLVRYRSERPMIQDNFGPYVGRESFAKARDYFSANDEEFAVRILEELGVRYVMSGSDGTGWGATPAFDSMAARLHAGYGSRRLRGKMEDVPGLARHRLVFRTYTEPSQSRRRVARRGLRPEHQLGVWEIVPGAKIVGRALPGSAVQLQLPVLAKPGAMMAYGRRAIANDAGIYTLVVPYPTDESFSPAVEVTGDYEIRAGTSSGFVRVREREIQAGDTIEGPDLR